MKAVILFVLLCCPPSLFAQIAPQWMSFFTAPGNVPETAERVVYDNSGNAEWTAIYNGQQNRTDRPYGFCVDNSGNVYVTGTSGWTSVAGKTVTLKYFPNDGWQRKCALDSSGTSNGEAHDVFGDDNGNVYVTGRLAPLNNSCFYMAAIESYSNGN